MSFADGPTVGRGVARRVVVVVAAGRVGIGVAALARPRLAVRPWVGVDDGPASAVLGRSLGGRDIALGLGLLLAANHDRPLRGWAEAAALADTGDVVATLAAFGSLPRRGRLLVLAASAAAAAAGWWAARSVD
ncbi:MAG TPA: hypothetical protein VHW47_08985 [Acidimicrobiales bacterium]|jgi:hypothetical protein|nr:hypothetical protein [Acidimicrobiales bacterium]